MSENQRFKRINMATKSFRVLVISACSLALGINTITCVTEFGQGPAAGQSPTTSVSYPQSYALAQTTKEFRQQYQQQGQLTQPLGADFYPMRSSTATMAAASSSQSGLATHRPNVYHSIVDGTGGPSGSASPAVQSSAATTSDLNTAAGHHHGHAYGKYYEYRAVPKPKTWKFGYKRGNHKHTISRHEHGKAGKHPHFKTKVKWHDKKSKGKGIHLWDYNHHDKKHYGYHHG